MLKYNLVKIHIIYMNKMKIIIKLNYDYNKALKYIQIFKNVEIFI